MSESWDWNRVLMLPEFWCLLYRTHELVEGAEGDPIFRTDSASPHFDYLAEELFFAGALETIEPANDPESLALADRCGDAVPRALLLRQLALSKLPRRCIDIRFPDSHTWKIEFGPQGSVAHYLMHPSFEESLLVGADDAHPSLPALRVHEAHSMARAALGADVELRYVSLLLHSVTGVSDDDRTVAQEHLRADWAAIGLLDASSLDRLIATLDRPWGTIWRRDERFGWINDCESSCRNPEGEHAGMSSRELARLHSFFEAIGATA
jgi:hypothetical protein